jgi:hypothetical protein
MGALRVRCPRFALARGGGFPPFSESRRSEPAKDGDAKNLHRLWPILVALRHENLAIAYHMSQSGAGFAD